jgi:hypothetical protein
VGHTGYLYVWIEYLTMVVEYRYLAAMDRMMIEIGCYLSALGGEVVAESVPQSLRALTVLDLYQEEGVAQEGEPELAQDEEGHFAGVEKLLEALWQRHLEGLQRNLRY